MIDEINEEMLDVVEDAEEEIVSEEPQDDGDTEEDLIISIGDEPPEVEAEEERKAPEWIKDLRKNDREKTRRIRELEEQLKAKAEPAFKLGEKPTLESCEYDPEQYEGKLAKWFDDKRKVDEENRKIEEEKNQAQKDWQDRLNFYAEEKNKLKVKDFEEAEYTIKEKLSEVQQGIIIQGAKNPALVVYALKMNPKKLADIAAIKDPVKYAFAVATLEADIKMRKREAPPPERKVSGTGSISSTVDSQLERLRKDAEKTGDYSKVHQYKRNKRQ